LDDEQDYTLIALLRRKEQSDACVEPGCCASGVARGSALTLTNPGID
jgi:hypothetical protein